MAVARVGTGNALVSDVVRKPRTDREMEVAWSNLIQGYRCLRCGQPALVLETEVICVNGKDCRPTTPEDQ